MLQRDLVMRAIEQLGAAVARALGLSAAGRHAEAFECIEAARSALPLGPGMVECASAESLVKMLGPDRARALAELLEAEARVLEQMGRARRAERSRDRGRRLLQALT